MSMINIQNDNDFVHKLANMDKSQLADECYIWRTNYFEADEFVHKLLSNQKEVRQRILSLLKDDYAFHDLQESIKSKNITIIKLYTVVGILLIFLSMNIASVIINY